MTGDTSVRKHIRTEGLRKRQGHLKNTPEPKLKDQVILLIDDDASALSALARLIRSAGFKVQMFDHPRALLGERLPIDNACLVADIYLPEMNGVELCDALAATGRVFPTILITGRNDEATRRLAEKSKAVTVLFKPVDEVPLLEAIAQCLGSKADHLDC
jgi:FixJ family two-component response regulator